MSNSNEIIPFAFGDNLVRTMLDEGGSPWWAAKDVCSVLGLENNRDAVSTLDDDEKITVGNTDGNPRAGQPHQLTFVNEPGLYSLIFRSRKPEAREFRRWVTHEVLPALRKTGRYIHPAAAPAERPPFDFEALPDDVRRIKPRVRERCMDLALQSARLSGYSSQEEQYAIFIDFCRVIGGPTWNFETLSYDGRNQGIAEYVKKCLIPAPGCRLQSEVIYRHFRQWWGRAYPDAPMPSHKAVSCVVKMVYHPIRSNQRYYLDVAFAKTN